jgi:serine protease Do
MSNQKIKPTELVIYSILGNMNKPNNPELATRIVQYFNNNRVIVGGEEKPMSIGEFVKQDKTANINTVIKYCSILEKEFIILSTGRIGGGAAQSCFQGSRISTPDENYNAYEHLCNGLLGIRNKFKTSVLPVLRFPENEKLDIGTAFYLLTSTGMFLITAAHCILGKEKIQILNDKQEPIIPEKIYVSPNEKIDIAALKISSLEKGVFPFWLGESEILEEVLIMGYPPIPGFDAFLVSDTATINSELKSSSGKLLGEEQSYLNSLDFMLINARVKGGNSGSPIINKYGYVIGILVNIPTDSKNNKELDKLGYGLGMSSKEIAKITLLINSKEIDASMELDFKILEDGFIVNSDRKV